MSLKVSLAFCIIFVSWSSVSGEVYTGYGDFTHNLEKCWSGGAESFTDDYDIIDQSLNNLGYNFFNENTVVTAEGTIILQTGMTEPVNPDLLVLDQYVEQYGVKTYTGQLFLASHSNWTNQKVSVWYRLIITPNDQLKFQHYVYAGSWGASSCATAISRITKVTVAN